MTDIISSLPSKADNTTTLNVAIPAGAVAGQVLAVYVGSSSGSGASVSSLDCTAVPGADVAQSTNSHQTLFTRTLDGTEGGSVLFSSTLATDLVATALLFPSGTVVNAVASPVAGYFSVDVSAPVVATTVADALIIRSLVTRDGEFTAPNIPVDTVVQDATDLVISKQQQAVIGNSSAEVFSVVTGNHAALLTVAFVSPSATHAIDTVGIGDSVTDGAVGTDFTVSGFGGDITSAKLTDATYDVPVTNLAGSGTDYTFDLPDVSAYTVDTTGIKFGTQTFEATDGTDTAQLSVTYAVKSGWAAVDVVSAIADDTSVLNAVFADGSQIYYDTSNNTVILPSGVWSTDGTTIDGAVWDISTGEWKPFTINVGMFDTEAPSVPTGVNAIATGHTTGYVSWNPSTDNTAVTGYRVFLDAVDQGTTTNTNSAFGGLTPETLYTVTVAAFDAAGNESAQSTGDTFTTNAEPTPGGTTIFRQNSGGQISLNLMG